MRRSLATVSTLLPLVVPLTGCGGNDSGAKAGAKAGSSTSTAATDLPTDLPTEIPSCLTSALPTALPTNPTEVPSDLASCLPSNLPTDIPTDIPTDVPTGASGAALDGCALVTPALITSDFGVANAGTPIGQASSFGDPNAKDCYYVGDETTIVVQATTRADQDMPASSNSYEGLPGAEPIQGATRGWAYVFPGQDSGDTIVSGLILVKGQKGLNFSITITGHPYTNATLQTFATHLLAGM